MVFRSAARLWCCFLVALALPGVLCAASAVGGVVPGSGTDNGKETGQIIIEPVTDRLAGPPQIGAFSAVLMDPVSGQVLYSRNPHSRLPMASTTKIMTAILLIENCGMDELVTASENACKTPFTSLHLKPGEQISAKDLLIGLMVRSANDAAVAAAEHIAGSVRAFARMMNQKAADIGCRDTNFVNPNGLYDPNHYSSAYDLCLMAKYAIRYPVFNEVVNTRKHILDSRTANREDLAVFSRHYFMKNYPHADGIKSGYVKQARYCYVGSATRDGWRLIAAVLKSENSGKDTIALLEYGFNNFRPVTIAGKGDVCAEVAIKGGAARTVPAAVDSDLRVVVPKTGATITTQVLADDITAPVEAGAPLGSIKVFVDGRETASAPLRAAEAVPLSLARRIWPWMKLGGLLIVCGAVGRRYGAALAKNPRCRRRGVAATLRNTDRFR